MTDLQTLQREGHIDLFYGDESGFSLLPVVPYGWQPPGLVVERPSRYSPRLNVLGWLSEWGELVHFVTEKSIDSQFVIDSISTWSAGLGRPTVLVLDNAPIHPVRRCGSKRFEAALETWQSQGLYVFFLPAYSPHLNKIETLWRKMKYEWLEAVAYVGYESLKTAVKRLLTDFGTTHTIEFSEKYCIIKSV